MWDWCEWPQLGQLHCRQFIYPPPSFTYYLIKLKIFETDKYSLCTSKESSVLYNVLPFSGGCFHVSVTWKQHFFNVGFYVFYCRYLDFLGLVLDIVVTEYCNLFCFLSGDRKLKHFTIVLLLLVYFTLNRCDSYCFQPYFWKVLVKIRHIFTACSKYVIWVIFWQMWNISSLHTAVWSTCVVIENVARLFCFSLIEHYFWSKACKMCLVECLVFCTLTGT